MIAAFLQSPHSLLTLPEGQGPGLDDWCRAGLWLGGVGLDCGWEVKGWAVVGRCRAGLWEGDVGLGCWWEV